MNKSIRRFTPVNLGLAALTVAATVCFAQPAHASFAELGAADGYAALILPGGSINMDINGGAAVVGDVGVTANSHLDLGSGAKVGPLAGTGTVVDGTIYLDPNGATVKLDNQPANTVQTRDLSQAVTDAIAAGQTFANMVATQTFKTLDITKSFTITGNGGLNVIDLDGINLHSNGVLTLSGSASDKFVFNITGTYTQSGNGMVQLSGGLTPDNILWNFIGGGTTPSIQGSTSGPAAYGTFLVPDRSFSITDTELVGSIIAQGDLKIGSKALVIQAVPEVTPSSVIFGFLGLVVAVGSRRTLMARMRALAAQRKA